MHPAWPGLRVLCPQTWTNVPAAPATTETVSTPLVPTTAGAMRAFRRRSPSRRVWVWLSSGEWGVPGGLAGGACLLVQPELESEGWGGGAGASADCLPASPQTWMSAWSAVASATTAAASTRRAASSVFAMQALSSALTARTVWVSRGWAGREGASGPQWLPLRVTLHLYSCPITHLLPYGRSSAHLYEPSQLIQDPSCDLSTSYPFLHSLLP